MQPRMWSYWMYGGFVVAIAGAETPSSRPQAVKPLDVGMVLGSRGGSVDAVASGAGVRREQPHQQMRAVRGVVVHGILRDPNPVVDTGGGR